MHAPVGFQAGVNLGGWLSQYPSYDHEHFQTFITKQDIDRIANWGADHVRLPIDYRILEDDDKPFKYMQSGFDYIDQCLNWCQINGLGVMLDLHHAPGFSFDASESSSLFANEKLKGRFVSLWEALADHYFRREEPALVFELLNEVVLPNSEPWNKLAHRVFSSIRAIDPDRWIVIGGNQWNSPRTLKEIELFDDPQVLYTFHYYEPLPFTHQKAYWIEALEVLDEEVDYPGGVPDMQEVLTRKLSYYELLAPYVECYMDQKLLRDKLMPVLDFQEQTGLPVYCGEFGVIDRAPSDSRLRWFRDFLDLLRESKIGYACWTYKLMDFGLVDQDSRVVDPELTSIIFSG